MTLIFVYNKLIKTQEEKKRKKKERNKLLKQVSGILIAVYETRNRNQPTNQQEK